jgi:hypothetical protein
MTNSTALFPTLSSLYPKPQSTSTVFQPTALLLVNVHDVRYNIGRYMNEEKVVNAFTRNPTNFIKIEISFTLADQAILH